MYRSRGVIGSLLSGLVATGMLLFAAWMQAWTGTTTAGEDGDDADGRSGRDFPVSGSGTPTTLHLSASGVTVLLVDASFCARIRIGEPEQAVVRMDDNLVGLVEARVDADQLRLSLRPGAQVRDATLFADITVRHINQITVGGTGRVSLDSELVGERLVLTVLGMSEISGVVRVERVEVGMSGASRLALSGHVHRLGITASGASELALPNLVVADLDARLSGAGIAEVTVRDTLTVQTSGAAALRYRGSPHVLRRQSTGASSVAPAE